eukprot:scaffold128798_cov90-Phaeocystis_antarctica.AAC.1
MHRIVQSSSRSFIDDRRRQIPHTHTHTPFACAPYTCAISRSNTYLPHTVKIRGPGPPFACSPPRAARPLPRTRAPPTPR